MRRRQFVPYAGHLAPLENLPERRLVEDQVRPDTPESGRDCGVEDQPCRLGRGARLLQQSRAFLDLTFVRLAGVGKVEEVSLG
ncbi:hypothetical protein [Salana multivorans]